MRRSIVLTAMGGVALVGAACHSKSPTAAPTPRAPTATSSAVASPPQVTAPAVSLGFYDGHTDAFISTDVSDKAQASAEKINYSPDLAQQKPEAFPDIYMVKGPAAPGQLMVFASEPGETSYSPIWREVTVTWKPGATRVLLVRDDQIKELAGKGMLTTRPTSILLNCPIVAVKASSATPSAVTFGFYDGHQDAYVSTDVSDKAEASSKGINFAPGLVGLKASAFPAIYMVRGAGASGQLTVFGSQPGEDSYSPLWDEATVSWNPGVTPVLLVRDDQIKMLASQGKLTLNTTSVLINCPIIAVGQA